MEDIINYLKEWEGNHLVENIDTPVVVLKDSNGKNMIKVCTTYFCHTVDEFKKFLETIPNDHHLGLYKIENKKFRSCFIPNDCTILKKREV